MDDQNLGNFVDKLIEEKGFPDLVPEVKQEIKQDLMTRLDNFITARIIARLSDQDVLQFENMLKEEKKQEEIQEFVIGRMPDAINFLTNTLLEFKAVYLGLIQPPPAAA